MKNLKELDLGDCKFIGAIPTSMVNLTHLTTSALFSNKFTSIIEFGMFTKLKSLELFSLSGELNLVYENSNYTFPRLEILSLSACNLTRFPHFLISLKGLTTLSLYKNRIGGEIPTWFQDIGKDTLEVLDLSSNLIKGGIEWLPWERMLSVYLIDNLLQGPLPIFPLPSLAIRSLDLSYNNFTSEIPSLICLLSSLERLYLAHNNISGSIPQCFGNLTKLKILDLHGNKLEGPLPRSLVNCTALRGIFLNDNALSDTFLHWLQAPR